MKEIKVKASVDTKSAIDAVEDLKKEFQEFRQEQSKSNKEMSSGVKESTKAIGGLSKGFKGLGLAIKATGIGLLIGVLNTAKELLMQNGQVAELFATAMNFLSTVVNDFVGLIVDNFDTITNFFTNPLESIKKLGDRVYKFIQVPIEGILETFGALGRTIFKLFQGDYAGAIKEAGGITDGFNKIVDGTSDVFSKIGDKIGDAASAMADYATSTANAASELTRLADAQIINEARAEGVIQQYERQAEIQRQLRDDERLTFEQRIAANEKLGQILEEQAAKERELAQDAIRLAQLREEQDPSNPEKIAARIQAQNKLLEIENRIETQRSEQLNNRRAIEREQAEEEKARLEQEAADEAEFAKLFAEAEKSQTEAAKKEAEKRKAIKEQEEAAKGALISQGFQFASQLAEQGTAQAKGIAAAEATFSTYAAIAAQLKTAAGSPGGAIPGYAIAQAIATGVFGLLQVRKILSTSTSSASAPSVGGGGGGGSVSVPSPETDQTVPNFDSINQGVGGTQNADFSPLRAYVVDQEIRNERKISERIRDQAKSG